MIGFAARRDRDSPFGDADVAAVFDGYPEDVRLKLLRLRALILAAASATPGVGRIQETLKWGQPSYLTAETRSGSTIRIDRLKSAKPGYAMFFNCRTDLVCTFRELYPRSFVYEGDRSIVFGADDTIEDDPLRHCIVLALTYHLRRSGRRTPDVRTAGPSARTRP